VVWGVKPLSDDGGIFFSGSGGFYPATAMFGKLKPAATSINPL